MRLLRVPRTAARPAQPFGEREQARQLGPDRGVAGVDEQRREVIGLDLTVEIGERDREHLLVGQSEALEHRRPRDRARAFRAARA